MGAARPRPGAPRARPRPHGGRRDRDGAPVTCSTRRAEIAALTALDLATTSAVTASALVDVLTAARGRRPRRDMRGGPRPRAADPLRHRPGRLDPSDPSDTEVAATFTPTNAAPSQGGGCSDRTPLPRADAFRRHGMSVRTAETPWQLDDVDRALTDRWLTERVAAAVEQQPDMAARDLSVHRRLMNRAPLHAVIYHVDLLALPNGGPFMTHAGPRHIANPVARTKHAAQGRRVPWLRIIGGVRCSSRWHRWSAPVLSPPGCASSGRGRRRRRSRWGCLDRVHRAGVA